MKAKERVRLQKTPPKKTGDKSFYKFIAQCVMNNWTVLTPLGDCCRYDCVLERGEGFERIQVKTGKFFERGKNTGFIKFRCSSSHYHTKQGQITKNYIRSYANEVEGFGVYCAKLDKCYLVPMKDLIGQKAIVQLRVDPPRNNQQKRVRWARKYEI